MIPSTPTRGNFRKHTSSNPLQQFFLKRFKKVICSLVKNISGDLCEVGCGEGFMLSYLHAAGILTNRRVCGVELDKSAIEFAKSHVASVGFVRANAYHLPFAQKQFNSSLMLEVLEHLEHPQDALSEICRVSHYVLLSVPHEPFFQAANFLRGKNLNLWGNDPEHIQHWNPESFRRLIDPFGSILHLSCSFPWIIALVKTHPAAADSSTLER